MKERDKHCREQQVNKKVPDFHCDLRAGHSEPHRDPATGKRWRHRQRRKAKK